jgi:two-component system, sensor histidine kinase
MDSLGPASEPVASRQRPARLDAVLDALEAALAPEAERAGLHLIGSYSGPADLALDLDSEGLCALMSELVRRAIAMTPEGVVELTIAARPMQAEVEVEIGVRDMGARVTASDFEASVAEARLKDQCVALGACYGREVNAGRGATSHVRLTAAIHQPETQAPSESELSDCAPRVLVVDDNATNLAVAKALCESFGFVVETAGDGVDAVEATERACFDVILMDIRMPRMDGVAATRAIHDRQAPGERTPILALTANNDHADVQTYLAAGMCAVVEKPIAPHRLLNALGAALNQVEAEETTTSTCRLAG